MKHNTLKWLLSLLVYFLLAVPIQLCAQQSDAQFVQVYVDEIKCISTTSDIGDDVDEIYLVAGGASRRGLISRPRIPLNANQDYFALDDGEKINVGEFMGGPLWEGFLMGDGDFMLMSIAVMEQDNAQLSTILHLGAAATAGFVAILGVPEALPIATQQAEAAFTSFFGSLLSSGDEFIGGITIHVIKQGQNLTVNWGARQNTTLIPQQGGLSAEFSATGGGQYTIKASVRRFVGERLVNKDSGKCLDVANASTANQANVQQYTCHGQSNQRWIIRPLPPIGTNAGFPPGWPKPFVVADITGIRLASLFFDFSITAAHSAKCLDVAGGSTSNQANVQQFAFHAGANQRWLLVPIGPLSRKEFIIVNRNSGKVLDVAGLSRNDGANVQQYEYNGGNNQIWRRE